MKKLLVAAIAVFTIGAVNAQEEGGFSKGSLFVTGAVGFGSEKDNNDNSESSSFGIEPKIGYFVSDNIAIGAKLGFGTSEFTDEDFTSETSDLTLGVFGRYYFTPASKFSLFAELGLDYMSSTFDPGDLKENTIGAGLNLGLNYFVSKNFAIEAYAAALGFASSKQDVDGAESVTSFGFGGDWRTGAVGLGVLYKF